MFPLNNTEEASHNAAGSDVVGMDISHVLRVDIRMRD